MQKQISLGLFVLMVSAVAPAVASAEQPETSQLESELRAQNERRIQTNQTGMGVLLGWAGLNLAAGTAGFFAYSGRRKYFHQMNAAWNVVNAAIATGGLVAAAAEDPGSYGWVETVREAEFIEKLLLFNAGLDVGYVAAGAYLRELGRRRESPRLGGYGDSLIVQGGFLFAFDVAMFWIHHAGTSKFYEAIRPMVGPGTGLSLQLSF